MRPRRLPEAAEEAYAAAREQRRVERAARRAHLAREASGEARGYRYAIECEAGWVAPPQGRGPHVHDDSCTHRDPVVYDGDRDSAQARAQIHAERNGLGGAIHHSPMIVPEDQITRRIAARRW